MNKTKFMSAPMVKMLKYTGFFFAAVFGIYGLKKLFFIVVMMFLFKPPTATISASIVANKTWQPYLESVGTVTAVNGVDLASEASGTVTEIHFNSGQFVKKNDVLIKLDDNIEQANLKSANAKLSLAKISFERQQTLRQKNVTSQSSYDESLAELQEAEAAVDNIKAQIQQKTITAPFDGKLGIRQVNLGQFVQAGTPAVTLQALNPLYVMFNIPEQNINALFIGQTVDVSVNNGQEQKIHGTITAINSKVNASTRNVLIQVTIANPKLELYPGMFASAQIFLKPTPNQTIVPPSAIAYGEKGDYVFIIKKEGSAKKPVIHAYQRFVTVGERREDEVAILSGLKAGEQVVTSGQLKLHDGATVNIDNKVEM